MKTNLKTLLVIIIGAAVIWGALYYWKNLRGVGPAIGKPAGDIAQEIEDANAKPENLTGLPLKLPEGFSIDIFAKDLVAPRMMAFDEAGTMLVSTSAGRVVAMPNKDNDMKADSLVNVLTGLQRPHGIAVKCSNGKCKLFVGEENQVSVYDYDQATYKVSNKVKLLDLPSGAGHFTRTIKFGPDDRLYISVGSSCNVCVESQDKRAKIFSMKADGSDLKEVARGLRNSVFFTWSYVDGKMWATEMGRDYLGDNIPPDEINVIESGKNYGWPNCYGKNNHDDSFDHNTYIRNPCQEPFETESKVDLQAHSAPLGLGFIPEEGWPEDLRNNLIVAFHGSWNRSVPTGYKLVRIKLDDKGNYLGTEDFITGWISDKGVLGRPVDVLIQPGGTMYVSDDKAGVIYRIYKNR